MAYDYNRAEILHTMEVCENRLIADTQVEYGYFDEDMYYAAFHDENLGDVNVILNENNNGKIYIHPYKGNPNKDWCQTIDGLTEWWRIFEKHLKEKGLL